MYGTGCSSKPDVGFCFFPPEVALFMVFAADDSERKASPKSAYKGR